MKRVLLFLSKTDMSIYNTCPESSKNNQLAFGLFVLLTGMLAFCSGTYAISNLFINFDGQTNQISYKENGWLYASMLGLFYAIIIVAIDREVVSAKNKMAVLPRLCLAIIIGVIVAIPVELKLLEGKIEKKLIQDYQMENSVPIDEKFVLLQNLEEKKESLKKDIKDYQIKIDYWSNHMQRELIGDDGEILTGKKGEGPAYRGAKRNMELHIENKKNAEKKLKDFENREYKLEKGRINDLFNEKQITQQFDLLSKFQALNRMIIDDDTGSTRSMSWGIRLLFILFEIIPSLIKLMTPPTEYDALLEARRRMNIQLTNVRANEALEDLENINDIIQDSQTPLPYMNEIKERIMV